MVKKVGYERNDYQAINAHAETVADNERQLLRLRRFKADRYRVRNIGLLLLSIGLFAVLLAIAYTLYKKHYAVEHIVETKVLEVITEVPGPQSVNVITREILVPGPERIVEVPGPERIIKVPGPLKIVIKKVPMQADKNLKEFVIFTKTSLNDKDIKEIVVGKKYKSLNSMFPYEQYCYAIAKSDTKRKIILVHKIGLGEPNWDIDRNTEISEEIVGQLRKISRDYCKFDMNPPIKKSAVTPFPKSKSPLNGSIASGSGFYVNDAGYVITNNHVVEKCNAVWLKEGSETYPASVVKTHVKNDLAIIKVNKKTENYAKFSSYVDPVEDVMAIGFPRVDILGEEIKRNKGSISSLTGIKGNEFSLQHTALIQKGSSGGPLINKKGAIVGVNYAKFTEDDLLGIGLAIKAVNTVEFLGENLVDFELDDSSQNKEWPEVFDNAKKFTTRVICRK